MAHSYFAIFGAMRTGSNLLERSLDHYAGLSAQGEAFNPHFIGKPNRREHLGVTLAQRNADPVAYLDRMIEAAGDEIPGFRIFDGHDSRLMDYALRDPLCAKLILSRDPVDSFISLKIAQETGQWMLVREENRRLAKINFNAEEYEAYLAGQQAHYRRLRRAALSSGQAVMEIAYETLGDLEILNGLARFVGSAEIKTSPPPQIIRQNPVNRADKVENLAELVSSLGGKGAGPGPLTPKARTEGVAELFHAPAISALYAPIAGAGSGELRRFLADASSVEGEESAAPVVKLKTNELSSSREPGDFLFSFVRHPAMRLMDVYLRRVAKTDAGPFAMTQMIMTRDYGAPSADEMADGGDAALAGLDAFISFVRDNLAGRTSVSPDPIWTPQSTLLASFAEDAPLDFLGRFERLEQDLGYVAGRIGVAKADLIERAAAQAGRVTRDYPPERWLTRRRETAIREAFEADYARLGYGFLSPAA